jgi:hypothetical protein
VPVNAKQVPEVLAVLLKHVPAEKVQPLLDDLQATQAYGRNSSFRQTIEALRMEAKHGRRAGAEPAGG